VVTTSTTILAFKWPSALTVQLVVSIRHIEDSAPHGLGGARVPLAKGKHKRTRFCTLETFLHLDMCMHRRSAAWCLTAHEMSHSAQYCALVNERSYGCFERAVCPSNQAADFSLEAFRPRQRVFGPLVIFIGQNPQPTPSGWRAVRQVRSSAESPNAQEHSGLRVLRWTAGDQQHWVLLD
jgi:hypothetical protein